MTCRNCGAGLEADRLDSSMGIVTCSHCGSLHELSNKSPGVASNTEPDTPEVKSRQGSVSLPSRFKVQRSTSSMEVSWAVGGLFHGVVLLIMAAGFAHAAFTSGLVFLLAGSIGLVYFAAVRAFNQHRIRVDSASLQVSQVPLPWPGSRKLNVSDIEQLFATEHKTRTEDQNHGKSRIRKHYRLLAKTRSRGQVKILSGLNEPHQALWLEQEIENLLGIGDKPVAGAHLE